jgi:hypothetical protein
MGERERNNIIEKIKLKSKNKKILINKGKN